jgi:uncharacterized delta-60 repeat protein
MAKRIVSKLMKLFVFFVFILQAAGFVFSAPGDLDTSFNGSGLKLFLVGDGGDVAYSSALQSDGKIVVVGKSERDFLVARYNSDGGLDVSFNGTGKVTTAVGFISSGNVDDQARDVAIQSDGKIVVVGGADSGDSDFSFDDYAIVRYNVDGSLDPTFGNNGVLIIQSLGGHSAEGVVIQFDGKIVVAGSSGIIRLNVDGSIDRGFAPITTCDYSLFNAVAIQSDDKIVASGRCGLGSVVRLLTARFNVDGSLDTTFGTGGVSRVQIGNSAAASDVRIQTDGKIVVGGSVPQGLAIIRLRSDGLLDTSFDTDGGVIVPAGTAGLIARSLVIQNDAKILVACSPNNGGAVSGDFTMIRLNENGSFDNTFGFNGKVVTAFNPGASSSFSAAIRDNGRIIAVGGFSSVNGDVALVQYGSDGRIDFSFGENGKVKTGEFAGSGSLRKIHTQTDGKIVAVGSSALKGTNLGTFTVVRVNSDGTTDDTFGLNGRILPIPLVSSNAYDLAIQNDGKILVVGYLEFGPTLELVVARFNVNGSLDDTFDGDGIAKHDFGSANSFAGNTDYSIALQNDGKIVVSTSLGGYYGIIRYNIDGTLDNSFGSNGVVRTAIGVGSSFPYSIVIQNDGKILAAGSSYIGNAPKHIVVRYETDGTLDNSFGLSGIATNTALKQAYSIAVQTDGKIVSCADSSFSIGGNTRADIALARFNTNGGLDPTFGINGIVLTNVANSNDDRCSDLALQLDGKIVVVGDTKSSSSHNKFDFVIARYNSNGSLDNTSSRGDSANLWGTNGIIVNDATRKIDSLSSVVIQADGKIVAGGIANGNFGFVRYIGNVSPTAANASISGRVKTSSGRGISRVRMTLTSQSGVVKTAMTNPFGYYRFTDLPVGEFYVLAVAHKKYQFTPNSRTFELFDDLDEVIFTADSTDNGRK